MKRLLIVALFACFALQGNSQTIAKSIFVEYGYTNLSKEDVGLYTMFGYTKYRVYDDEKFLKIESVQDLPKEEAQKMGPGLRSCYFKDKAGNALFLCISLDSLHIRMKAGNEEEASYQEMISAYNSGSDAVYGTGMKRTDIQGFSCGEILIAGMYADTISAFVADQVVLDPVIADFPLFAASHGLILGRNEILSENQLEFRAIKLEINQPRDYAAELASYQLVTKEEGEMMLKAAFTKMMGMPTGDGKN